MAKTTSAWGYLSLRTDEFGFIRDNMMDTGKWGMTIPDKDYPERFRKVRWACMRRYTKILVVYSLLEY